MVSGNERKGEEKVSVLESIKKKEEWDTKKLT